MGIDRDIIVVGGGTVGACCALELARAGATVTLLEKEPQICPPESGAHANCGLLVPSHVTPLAAPGVLGQGLRWMLDASSPFYIAPRPSPALVRWLWLYVPVLFAAYLANRLMVEELRSFWAFVPVFTATACAWTRDLPSPSPSP